MKNTSKPSAKEKIPVREQILLEKERIQHEIGDLEQIRLSLGLSQRKLCLLLLVDPSAWTRWLKTKDGAPPHIYQALRWLLELKKTNPDAATPSNLGNRVDLIHSTTQSKFKEIETSIALLERSMGMVATREPISVVASSHPDDSHLKKEVEDLKKAMSSLLSLKRAPRKKPKKKIKQKPKSKPRLKLKPRRRIAKSKKKIRSKKKR